MHILWPVILHSRPPPPRTEKVRCLEPSLLILASFPRRTSIPPAPCAAICLWWFRTRVGDSGTNSDIQGYPSVRIFRFCTSVFHPIIPLFSLLHCMWTVNHIVGHHWMSEFVPFRHSKSHSACRCRRRRSHATVTYTYVWIGLRMLRTTSPTCLNIFEDETDFNLVCKIMSIW